MCWAWGFKKDFWMLEKNEKSFCWAWRNKYNEIRVLQNVKKLCVGHGGERGGDKKEGKWGCLRKYKRK